MAALALTSPDFTNNQPIPDQFSCKGANISPALNWVGVPENTKSFAILVIDPDAPSGEFVHWVVYNIAPSLRGLKQGDKSGVSGLNHLRKAGYGGPCPPAGQTHRYVFHLFALDQELSLKEGASREDVEKAMKGHILDSTELTGTFRK